MFAKDPMHSIRGDANVGTKIRSCQCQCLCLPLFSFHSKLVKIKSVDKNGNVFIDITIHSYARWIHCSLSIDCNYSTAKKSIEMLFFSLLFGGKNSVTRNTIRFSIATYHWNGWRFLRFHYYFRSTCRNTANSRKQFISACDFILF